MPRRQADLQQAVLWARVTLALVVAALLGVIALPNREASPAELLEAETHAALEALRDFRGAIEAYRIDHGAWPAWGADAGEESCAEVFTEQLSAQAYLPGGLPANPINGLATIRVLRRDQPWPLTADDRTGWIYDPRSGLVKLNSQGRLAGSDVRYFDR